MTETEYVPIENLSKHLSVKVTTLRQWVKLGYVPKETYIKVGNTYRFSIPAVVNALRQDMLKESTDDENKPVQLELDFDENDDV
jgi:hypothetical protein